MSARRHDSELLQHRRLAEQLAARRKERVTSAHLLAAIASCASPAAELLVERRLDAERLMRAARAATDDEQDPLRRAIGRAREVAQRMGAGEPLAVHLLIALMSDRRSAAHRALDQCGVDVSRLRVAAMNIGLGLVGKRRIVTRRDGGTEARTVRRFGLSGVRVPLVPPVAPVSTGAAAGVAELLPATSPPSDVPAPVERPSASRAKRTAAPSTVGSKFALDPKKFPVLCALGRNLTLAAAEGQLDPVVSRELEVEQTLDVLAKRHANNPCLVGAAGVGKTSVIRALSQRIAAGDSLGPMDDRIVVEIPVGELVAGTGVRGALAQRVALLHREVAASERRVVLFFDEIDQLLAGDGSEELVTELKAGLAKGELPCIGATTYEGYKKAIESDAALARRFSVVEVAELCQPDAFLVLEALAPSFEAHHGVQYSEEALAAGVAWSVRYLPGRALPDKAVSIIDLAGARARRRGQSRVTPEEVASVVAEMVDMPVERLLETDRARMLRLEELLADRVVGHEHLLRRIARILRRNAAGLGARRPIGTFLLLGPTGVGKTETAKAIAEALFFSETAMTRIDMSEYGEAHATARLIGAPPGYVGFEAGGQLTEAVRRRPYQVVLLDEVEKAHPEVLETFLAVFDEGRLTDGRGRTVDFTNTVILLTSNLGAEESGARPRRRAGFSAEDGPLASEVEEGVAAAARAALAPELYNRIDEVLVFLPLRRQDVFEIARRLLLAVGALLEAERGICLEFDDDVVEALLDAGGFDPTLGARPMKRTIARLVEAPLAERILSGDVGTGGRVRLRARGSAVEVEVIVAHQAAE